MHDLYTIGIPTFVVLIGILLNQRGFERQDARMDRIESHLARVQMELSSKIDRVQVDLTAKIDRVQADLTAKIDRVQADLTAKIDRVQADLTARIDRIQADLSQFYRTLGEHDGKLDLLISDRPKPKL